MNERTGCAAPCCGDSLMAGSTQAKTWLAIWGSPDCCLETCQGAGNGAGSGDQCRSWRGYRLQPPGDASKRKGSAQNWVVLRRPPSIPSRLPRLLIRPIAARVPICRSKVDSQRYGWPRCRPRVWRRGRQWVSTFGVNPIFFRLAVRSAMNDLAGLSLAAGVVVGSIAAARNGGPRIEMAQRYPCRWAKVVRHPG